MVNVAVNVNRVCYRLTGSVKKRKEGSFASASPLAASVAFGAAATAAAAIVKCGGVPVQRLSPILLGHRLVLLPLVNRIFGLEYHHLSQQLIGRGARARVTAINSLPADETVGAAEVANGAASRAPRQNG